MIKNTTHTTQNNNDGNLFLIRRSEFVVTTVAILEDALNVASNYASDIELINEIASHEDRLKKFSSNFCQASKNLFDSELSACSQNINDEVFSNSYSGTPTDQDEVIKSWMAHKYKLYMIKLGKVHKEQQLPKDLLTLLKSELNQVRSIKKQLLNENSTVVAA